MIILRPLPIAVIAAAGGSGTANLITPDPKEIWDAGIVASRLIDIDLGSAQEIDSFFVGFTNAEVDATWHLRSATGMGTGVVAIAADAPIRAADSLGPRHHGFRRLPAPVTSRYFQIRLVQTGTVPLQVGAIALGKAFVAPYEFGGGRQPIDTGTKEALMGGGFGIGEGVVKAALRWTFTDLDPATRRHLWALVRQSGETKPIVVVEETGETEGLGEEIHYGLFDRFETYERQAASLTRWSMSMTEWA